MSGCRTPEQKARLAETMRRWHRERREFGPSPTRTRDRHGQAIAPPNRGLLVPWGKSKCGGCGTTLVSEYDVQTHNCIPMERACSREIDAT